MTTNPKYALLLIALSSVVAGVALAADTEASGTPATAATAAPIITAPSRPQPSLTEQWLQLQASGKAASTRTQQASAAERELANQRLLDSYSHPIPEYMPRTTLTE